VLALEVVVGLTRRNTISSEIWFRAGEWAGVLASDEVAEVVVYQLAFSDDGPRASA